MAATGPQALGDYLLIEQVGEGGMAEVYRAQYVGKGVSLGPNTEVVVKRIKPSLFKSTEFPIFREMFLNEAKLVRGLQHPNLTRTFALEEAVDGTLGFKVPFIVSEYIRGQQLWQLMRIATYGFTGRPMPPRIATFVAREIARGLGHAHMHKDAKTGKPQPIIHRDVSPENVMISTEGAVKVIDFGVAKAIGGFGPQTQTGIIKGKLAYMAPEQVAQKVVPATDVFGAAIVLWEMLTGRRLFGGGNEFMVVNRVLKADIPRPSATTQNIPKELEDVLMTALTRDLTIRYTSGIAFADALTGVMNRVPSLRGCTNLDLKRWAQETQDEGKKIASGWEDDAGAASPPAGAAAESAGPGRGTAGAAADADGLMELSGDDVIFSGIDGEVDPGVKAVVTQGLRALTPDMLARERARMLAQQAEAAAATGEAPLPGMGSMAALPGMKSGPVQTSPPAATTSVPSRGQEASTSEYLTPVGKQLPPTPMTPATPAATAPIPAQQHLQPPGMAARLAERSASFLARVADHVAEHRSHQLPAALQSILADRELVKWLAAVAGLFVMLFVLLLILLISQC
ncbi:MAG TPA: serine/threonine-protein kinase [Pseudomonadota bacterium]|nr:serine/threonine-protein kinase [Pseudomonadota bacterium]